MWCTMAIGKRLVVKLSIASTDGVMSGSWESRMVLHGLYNQAHLMGSLPSGTCMIQLSMQNVLHACVDRVHYLCTYHLVGADWNVQEWAQLLLDISVSVGVNPVTWPAWIVLAEWLVAKGIVAPSSMQ